MVKVRSHSRKGTDGVKAHDRNVKPSMVNKSTAPIQKKPFDEWNVNELILYIENDYGLYQNYWTPIQKNLSKKFKKGIYDKDKALISYKKLADEGAKKYNREIERRNFSVGDREEVARRFRDNDLEEMAYGNL